MTRTCRRPPDTAEFSGNQAYDRLKREHFVGQQAEHNEVDSRIVGTDFGPHGVADGMCHYAARLAIDCFARPGLDDDAGIDV